MNIDYTCLNGKLYMQNNHTSVDVRPLDQRTCLSLNDVQLFIDFALCSLTDD